MLGKGRRSPYVRPKLPLIMPFRVPAALAAWYLVLHSFAVRPLAALSSAAAAALVSVLAASLAFAVFLAGLVSVVAAASVPHSALRNWFQVWPLSVPASFAALYLVLHSAMANGYVDLGTYVGITPYVGGGIGVAYNKYFKTQGERNCVEIAPDSSGAGGFTCDDPAGYQGSEDSEAKFNLAYSIGAGLSYQVSKNVSVDLGYEYFSVPSAKFVAYDSGAFNIHKGIDYQTVKLGLRYDLW